MNVKTDILEIEKPQKFSTEYVEKVLAEKKINPLRWSIVDIKEETILLNVSY